MGKKGKKTRWRRLPIGGTDEQSGLSLDSAPPTSDHHHRITFNEDEYTKITTPRQDVLFKKGYFGRKRAVANPSPSCDSQEMHSNDSVESESYMGEDAQLVYPAGYIDPTTGVYYVNGSTYETYDPYTNTVTVVVGPPAPGPPVLAALPCQPVPLQPLEWFNPPAPWHYAPHRKRYSTDSQNCSAQSSESPGSPQEPVDEAACALYPPQPQYIYPGYMFGPPVYTVNGMTMQGVLPQPTPTVPDSKRRKKRRRRRRGGVTDDGSESSCCEEAEPGCQSGASSDVVCQSGASSDAGSKGNSDSGIHTDPTPSPPPPLHDEEEAVHDQVQALQESTANHAPQGHQLQKCPTVTTNQDFVPSEELKPQEEKIQSPDPTSEVVEELKSCSSVTGQVEMPAVTSDEIYKSTTSEVTTPEDMSAAEDDITPDLCPTTQESSSQESTLSCLSTPTVTRDCLPHDNNISVIETSPEEVFESCQSLEEDLKELEDESLEVHSTTEYSHELLPSTHPEPLLLDDTDNDLKTRCEGGSSTRALPEDTKEAVKERLDEEPLSKIELQIPTSQIPEEAASDQELEIFKATPCLQVEEDIVKEFEVAEEIKEIVTEPPKYKAQEKVFDDTQVCVQANSYLVSDNCSRFPTGKDSRVPVPPPRRKRSMCRAAEKLATRIVEDAIREGVEEASHTRLASPPLSITEAVTQWLRSQESSPLTYAASETESEEEVEEEGTTGQKNVRGNPFLAPSHSGVGQRVATADNIGKDSVSVASSATEWDFSHARDMCDPARSVDKYYRLGADSDVSSPSVYKTAMHIRHNGPFPCGVCCIIQ